MTAKRFTYNVNKNTIECDEKFVAYVNSVDGFRIANKLTVLAEENEQLKTEIHLAHMRSMFSTVKSFKGDISERYVYSDEKDTIYDTANHYGQYYKILDKKEITMLLNEYETILKGLEE